VHRNNQGRRCGGDENSSKDMGAIVATTGVLQEGTDA
jgi:hypothetical protein